jgi:hypothetical protein
VSGEKWSLSPSIYRQRPWRPWALNVTKMHQDAAMDQSGTTRGRPESVGSKADRATPSCHVSYCVFSQWLVCGPYASSSVHGNIPWRLGP